MQCYVLFEKWKVKHTNTQVDFIRLIHYLLQQFAYHANLYFSKLGVQIIMLWFVCSYGNCSQC